ncbi:MAG: type II toxin-antitoxin system VapC family toxin [Ilumatobacteraceae bacterium]
MIVIDASVVVTALADDGHDGTRVRARLQGERLIAPALLDIEATSAWRRLAAAGNLDDRRAQLAIIDLRQLRVDRISHLPLLDRCWELRHSLSTYDAVYVALAEIIGVSLLTGDAKLARAPGTRCRIELLQ